MKAYKDSRGTDPPTLNLDTSWTSVVNVTPRLLNSQYPSNMRLCVAQSRIGRYSRRVKSLASTGIRTADRLAPSLVAMPTELSRLFRMSRADRKPRWIRPEVVVDQLVFLFLSREIWRSNFGPQIAYFDGFVLLSISPCRWMYLRTASVRTLLFSY